MTLDSDQAALLVRATARVSAAVFAVSLVAAARRLRASDTALRRARRNDLAAFAAWVAAHTIHFAAVILLAVASGGQNIRDAGGWTGTIVVALAFYLACAAVLRAKWRPTGRWTTAGTRRTEVWTSVVIWIVFFQAYVLRLSQSLLFVALAVGLAAALGLFLTHARAPRSSNMQRSSVGVS